MKKLENLTLIEVMIIASVILILVILFIGQNKKVFKGNIVYIEKIRNPKNLNITLTNGVDTKTFMINYEKSQPINFVSSRDYLIVYFSILKYNIIRDHRSTPNNM